LSAATQAEDRDENAVGGTERRIVRIKPMRDVMVKEAAYHCHTRGIETYNLRGWDTFEGSAQVNGGARKVVVGEARGKGGVRSLEKLTEGEKVPSWDPAQEGGVMQAPY
jgi:hypothetical protein